MTSAREEEGYSLGWRVSSLRRCCGKGFPYLETIHALPGRDVEMRYNTVVPRAGDDVLQRKYKEL